MNEHEKEIRSGYVVKCSRIFLDLLGNRIQVQQENGLKCRRVSVGHDDVGSRISCVGDYGETHQ